MAVGEVILTRKMALRPYLVGFAQPGGYLVVQFIWGVGTEIVDVTAGRQGLNPVETGVFQSPCEDHVGV